MNGEFMSFFKVLNLTPFASILSYTRVYRYRDPFYMYGSGSFLGERIRIHEAPEYESGSTTLMFWTGVLYVVGDNCLHCAVSSPFPKRKSIVETLCRKGCNLNEKNKEFLTPLHVATGQDKFVFW